MEVDDRGGTTEIRLEVDGLLPNRGYAAHAHATPAARPATRPARTSRTEVDPAAAPGKPSTDPAYANPQNEIWLDLRTDGDGDGESRAEVPVRLHRPRPGVDRDPRGRDDGTAPGQAGSAGARLACLTVPFR